jgi:hypothetical protein
MKAFSTEGVASGKRPSLRIKMPSRKHAISKTRFGIEYRPCVIVDRSVLALFLGAPVGTVDRERGI